MSRSSSDATDSTAASIGPYWDRSRTPLQILVFVLPLVAIYELGLLVAARSGTPQPRLLAYSKVEQAFEAMGLATAGYALPAILVVVALLAWQILARKPWRVHWPTAVLMAVESMVLAVPLLLLATVLVGGTAAAQIVDGGTPSLGSRLVMSIGAGLYEEFLFRWILIATIHAILADGLRVPDRVATGVAVLISSVLFMVAHQPAGAAEASFYLASGVFFSAIYVVREYGVAAGTHAGYDVLVEILGASG